METADTREPDDLGSARRLCFLVSQEGHPPLMWIPARADLRQVPGDRCQSEMNFEL